MLYGSDYYIIPYEEKPKEIQIKADACIRFNIESEYIYSITIEEVELL